jgi:predicted nuclease of predicted toxin-antitoxin system
MNLKLLIDMNLSPDWVTVFQRYGWLAVHWSGVGNPAATDRVIMDWALANQYVVFTHDLDFGTILAVTQAAGPSIIQVRTQDILPTHLERIVVGALQKYEAQLEAGAIVVVDERKSKVRILPLSRK